ncbi:hypothetical protein PROFUN_11916 [Planoprotostelium fungivorum]|uniref:Poly [ADP-ribose] polymerase n=1 Tax=Planoprotostelium fungivorum TaxID=1890364 RepID=A0A2P6N8Q3_9EUKA|nr:hypothetical protein PROFUN_11916 [Planoprotostelium fungivorum]
MSEEHRSLVFPQTICLFSAPLLHLSFRLEEKTIARHSEIKIQPQSINNKTLTSRDFRRQAQNEEERRTKHSVSIVDSKTCRLEGSSMVWCRFSTGVNGPTILTLNDSLNSYSNETTSQRARTLPNGHKKTLSESGSQTNATTRNYTGVSSTLPKRKNNPLGMPQGHNTNVKIEDAAVEATSPSTINAGKLDLATTEDMEHYLRNQEITRNFYGPDEDQITDMIERELNRQENTQPRHIRFSGDGALEVVDQESEERAKNEWNRRQAERKNLIFPSHWEMNLSLTQSLPTEGTNYGELEVESGQGRLSRTFSNGALDEYHEVTLRADTKEYEDICKMINNQVGVHSKFGLVQGKTPASFQVTKVVRVQNELLWRRYSFHKELIDDHNHNKLKLTKSSMYLNRYPIITPLLDAHVNEYYLWHGTSSRVIDMVGFDERVSAMAGMFGAGIYFAENASKSNQYVPCPVCGQGSILSEKPNCVCNTLGGSEMTLLLCRVIMGDVHIVTNYNELTYKGTISSPVRRPPVKNKENPGEIYDSVLGESKKHIPSAFLSYREMVVYDRSQVYPEYIVHYRRIPSNE